MADTIKEFLVSLGFKVDESSYGKFIGAIGKATKETSELGGVVVATAMAIGVSVDRIARQYESLYYVSQRTGSAVTQLRAFEFGSKQVGVSADAARASVEGFAQAMRTNPGLAAFFGGMRVDTKDAVGSVIGIVERLKGQFGEGGYFIAAQIASMANIDEQTFRQYWVNLDKLKSEHDENMRRDKAAGLNIDANKDKWLEFARTLNRVEGEFGRMGQAVALYWLDPAIKTLKSIDDLAQGFNHLDLSTKAWIGTLASAVSAGGVLYVLKALLVRVGLLTGAAATAEGVGGAAGGLIGLAGLGGVGVGLGAALWPTTANSGENEYMRAHPTQFGSGQTKATNERAAYIRQLFEKMGWSREAAAGLAAGFIRESRGDPNAVGDFGQGYGAGQWHPDRQAAFKAWAGKDIRGSTLEEQVAFSNYELTQGNEQFAGRKLRQARTGFEAGQIASKFYERPQDQLGEMQKRGELAEQYLGQDGTPGSASVQINQRTQIQVHGNDPTATAKAVAEEQGRVNGDLVRNAGASVR